MKIKSIKMSKDAKQLLVIWGAVAVLLASISIALHIYVNTPVKADTTHVTPPETTVETVKTSKSDVKKSETTSNTNENAYDVTEVTPTHKQPQVHISENKTVTKEVKKSEPAPAKNQMPERIPFTNKPVTPGVPESYIGTYGQCPFYENAMHGGCYPPSDIQCNDDWSHCEYVGTRFGE